MYIFISHENVSYSQFKYLIAQTFRLLGNIKKNHLLIILIISFCFI